MSNNTLKSFLLVSALGGFAPWAIAVPVADAGADRLAYRGYVISLVSGGYSPEGRTITEVLWNVETTPANADFNLLSPEHPGADFVGNTPGLYDLSFKVYDGGLWSALDMMSIQVVTNTPPVAIATATPSSGVTPFSVIFDASASFDPEGSLLGGPLTYYWNLGDGSDGSYEPIFTHVYTIPGSFGVTLEVTDEIGLKAYTNLLVEVARFNLAPVLSTTAQPLSGIAPLAVQFLANAMDPDNDPLTYLWDFGDPFSPNDTSTLRDPSYVYTEPGTYQAWLTVDDGRLSMRTALSIEVQGNSVPEPSTWALLLQVLAMIGFVRRGRRNAHHFVADTLPHNFYPLTVKLPVNRLNQSDSFIGRMTRIRRVKTILTSIRLPNTRHSVVSMDD